MAFNPDKKFLGNYSPNDGTIEFYGRINSVINSEMILLDLGAGRAGWFEDDPCHYRRNARRMIGKVKYVIATDLDPVVLNNKACDQALVMNGGVIPLDDSSVDVIIADWVLEHVENTELFRNEVNRILRPGGYFCARTPHGASYLSVAARVISNSFHSKLLKLIQPNRQPQDVFPTCYRMNSLRNIEDLFHEFINYSYIFRANPAYYFGNKFIYYFQAFVHRLMPSFFSGCLYVFLKKPNI